MSETKKKRAVKPEKTQDVWWVLELCPFFNAKTEEARIKFALSWLSFKLGPDSVFKSNEENTKWINETAEKIMQDKAATKLFRESFLNLRSAIDIALNYEETQKKCDEISKWLEDVFNLSISRVSWKRRGFTITSREFNTEILGHESNKLGVKFISLCFQTMAVNSVCYVFASQGFDSIGSYFIGMCPRCEKVFEKKRGDQEYCGKACKAATTQSRYDKKKKRS